MVNISEKREVCSAVSSTSLLLTTRKKPHTDSLTLTRQPTTTTRMLIVEYTGSGSTIRLLLITSQTVRGTLEKSVVSTTIWLLFPFRLPGALPFPPSCPTLPPLPSPPFFAGTLSCNHPGSSCYPATHHHSVRAQ